MSISKLLFNNTRIFKVISLVNELDKIRISLVSKSKQSTCPNCELPSSKSHSYYIRKIVDLPIFGKQTLIKLKARKFYCSTLECPLKIFTERFKSIFSSYQRRSDRLTKKLLNLVILTGGRPAEKICAEFSVTVSDTSLLRIIAKQELPTTAHVTYLGVDDWAIRKRERYGSILIDLNTNKPIGLLKDREENTFSNWLTQNKQIQLISRDRFINYQRASTQGAPQALQVADRWHLLKNLGETVRKILDREYVVIQKMREKNTMTVQPENKRRKTKTSNHQLQRFTQVKELLAQSKSHREISKLLHMSRVTVKKYELYDKLPAIHCQSSTGIEKHLEYIESRIIQQPTILLKTLHSELKNRGYRGAYNTLSDSLKRFQISIGKAARNKVILPSNLVFWRPSRTMILFVTKKERINKVQRQILDQFCELSPTLRITGVSQRVSIYDV